MMAQELSLFILRLEQAHQSIRDELENIDLSLEIYPGWTIKEMLAHLTGWDEANIASLHAQAEGQDGATPALRGINFYNAQSVATREALNYEQILREWELAHQELISALENFPPEKLIIPMLFSWGRTGTIAALVDIFEEHALEHAQDIRAAKQKKKG